jgi:AcrR family transcriptional regulator
VPRDPTETRERLVREAERLFAERGVLRTTTKEIVEAAGQRNNSALTYHFGSRDGLLRAILQRHDAVLDEERGRLLDRVGEDAPIRSLVAVLLQPYAAPLADRSGRDFLRIVAQLTEAFPSWRTDSHDGSNLRRVLGLLEARQSTLPRAVRQQRIVAMITLMTSSMADRAARIEEGRRLTLAQPAFLGNLADMIVALLDAPRGEPLSPRA